MCVQLIARLTMTTVEDRQTVVKQRRIAARRCKLYPCVLYCRYSVIGVVTQNTQNVLADYWDYCGIEIPA